MTDVMKACTTWIDDSTSDIPESSSLSFFLTARDAFLMRGV